MGKKLIGLLLLFTLIFAFTACGSDKAQAGKEDTSRSESKLIETTDVQGPQTSEDQTGEEPEQTTRILVAYFSRADENYDVGVIEKGNTEIIAEMIAEELGADTFKIERATAYPADYRECTDEAKKEQNDNARPELKNTLDNMDEYDVIYLGTPIWWGDMPMPVYTFIESLDWNGKTIYPFTTHGGSRLANIPKTMQETCEGATIEDGLAILGSDAQNDREKARRAVHEWLNK